MFNFEHVDRFIVRDGETFPTRKLEPAHHRKMIRIRRRRRSAFGPRSYAVITNANPAVDPAYKSRANIDSVWPTALVSPRCRLDPQSACRGFCLSQLCTREMFNPAHESNAQLRPRLWTRMPAKLSVYLSKTEVSSGCAGPSARPGEPIDEHESG